MIYDEKYDIPIFEDEDILDAVDYSEKLKNALVTKFDKDNNTINIINDTIDGISNMLISINRTKADANSVYTKKESDNKYANAIKQELTKAKEAQINSTGANLQNVQFFGESVQETREGYNLLKYPYASLFTDTIFTDVGDGTIKLNGTLEANTSKYFVRNYFVKAGTYTFLTGLGRDINLPNTCYFLVKKSTETSYIVQGARKDTEFTLDVDSNIDISMIFISGTYNNVLLKPMLISGTITSAEEKVYEQYGAMPSIDNPSLIRSITGTINYKTIKEENEKITSIEIPEGIELYSTQNIADVVDNTGIIHKNIKNYTLTGNENWAKSSFSTEEFSVFYSTNTISSLEGSYILCTHFKVVNGIGNSEPTQEGISYTAPNLGLRISISTAKSNTVEEFKELLKNNTIKIYYACIDEEKTTQSLVETEKTKLQNLATFTGINNITSNAPLSATYNIDTKIYIDSKFNTLAQQILNIVGGN